MPKVDPRVAVAAGTTGEGKPNGQGHTEPAVNRGGVFMKRYARIPEWVVGGILPRGSLYALTAKPGHGKTAVATLLQLCIASGTSFARRTVHKGQVLVLCGENPEDYALRLVATLQALGLDHGVVDSIGVIPGSFAIGALPDTLRAGIAAFGEVVAVFVDTSAAYFGGEEENSNVDMRAHASHLRALCRLPGNPVVVVLCHPHKNPTKDNLLPRGGSAFVGEIDGNLTLWMEERGVTSLHWHEKIRAVGFEPLSFELVHQQIVISDANGQPTRGDSVAAVHIEAAREGELADRALDDENQVLRAMGRKADATVRELTDACHFTSTSKTHGLLGKLAEAKLVQHTRRERYALTRVGKVAAKDLSG